MFFIPVFSTENPKNIYTAIVSTVSMVSGVKETKNKNKNKMVATAEHLEAFFYYTRSFSLLSSSTKSAQRESECFGVLSARITEMIALTFFIRSVILQCERQNSREDKIH